MRTAGILIFLLLAMLARPAWADPPIIIGMYGDSTMHGDTLASPSVPGVYIKSPNNIPDGVQWSLTYISGYNVVVENHGAGGTNCSMLLWGGRPDLLISRSWTDEMAASPASIVVVNDGLNGDNSDADFTWCYTQLWAIAVQHGKIFVIQTPNPVANDPNGRIAHIVDLERKIAGQYSIFVIDEYTDILNNVVDWKKRLPDGIHPDGGLYGYMADVALRVLAPLVALLGG